MESCAYKVFSETVNSESTVCGSSDEYPGDEDLIQPKECTRDLRAHLASFGFFLAKKIDVQVLIIKQLLNSVFARYHE